MTTLSASTNVAVYQTWELDRDLRLDIQDAARAGDVKSLRRLFRNDLNAGYCGSFDLAEDTTLNGIFRLLQNESHAEGWVAALDTQRNWLTPNPGASLSVGDILVTDEGTFVVSRLGFVQIP